MDNVKKDSNIKDINPDSASKDKPVDLNFVLLKAHKLSAALYLITNNLSDQDPLKWRLREMALETVSDVSDLVSSRSESRQIGILEGVANRLLRVTSFIDIAVQNRTVSEMNLNILKQEYLDLRSRLDAYRSQIQPALFTVPSGFESLTATNSAPVSSLGTMSAQSVTQPTVSKTGTKGQSASRLSGDSARRETIVSFVKKHGWSSIKDISRAVPDVSSKTVQRELAELVRHGVLKKEGDRRWSRYSL